MAFELIKGLAKKTGTYRAARWVHRHLMNREELHQLRSEYEFYSQFIKPGTLCFDVGANYGAKSEVFLKLGAKVVAFEPQHDCAEELRARLGTNPRLTLVNEALGSQPGMLTLYVMHHRSRSSLIKTWGDDSVGSYEVPVTTLDEAIRNYGKPDYCKIDVEGYDLEVIKGLNCQVPLVSFEYHIKDDGVEQALACLEHLSRLGPIRINITGAEQAQFIRFDWWELAEFIPYLRHEVPCTKGYYYGDIFVKIG
jgi:FkbM family methyltransferase